MNVKRLISLMVLIIIACGFVSAEVVLKDVEVKPEVVWLHEGDNEISVYARCIYDDRESSISTVTASILSHDSGIPSTSELYYKSEEGRYELEEFSFPFSETGVYWVNVTCSRNDEATSYMKKLVAKRLDLEIIKEGDLVDGYMGDYLPLKVNFRLDDGEGKRIIPPPQGTFYVEIGDDYTRDLGQGDIKIIGNEYQSLSIEIPKDSDDSDYLSEGIYDLDITGKYTEYGKTTDITTGERAFVRINPALKISLPEEKITCIANEICEIGIDATVVYPVGDIDDFSLDNVEAVLVSSYAEGRKIYVDDILCDEKIKRCKMTMDIPSTLDPGAYDLYITVAHPSISSYEYKSKSSIPLDIVSRFTGEVKDASGSIIETRFTIENRDTGEIITAGTDNAGVYNLDLLPGEYDFEIRFIGGVVSKFSAVEITADMGALKSNFVRYDRDNINAAGPGTKMVKIVVLEFALPFENAGIYMPYDSSKVNRDEEDLSVHNCNKWNFKKRICTGEWTELDRKIHTIQDSLEFDTESSGAFVIGERRSLAVTAVEVKTEKVYIGEPVSVIGKIVDADDTAVEDIGVTVSFPRFNISKSTLSKAGGLFSLDISAPYAEGPVDMVIAVSESLFAVGNVTKSVDVMRKKELSIVGVPDMLDVDMNKETLLKFKLFNSGQTDLTKPISMHMNGISTDWYEILPLRINSIPANTQKDVELRIKLTEELCGGACPKFSLVTVEVASDEISKTTSFTMRVNQQDVPANNTAKPEGAEEEGGRDLFALPKVTGLVAMPNLNFDGSYLYLTVIVVLLVLIVSKKKKKKKTGLRAPVVASLHRIKTGI